MPKEIDSDSEIEVEEEEQQVEEEEQVDTTLNNSDVVTKYQEAAKITQAVLADVAAKCVPGAAVLDLTLYGDAEIEKRVASVFNKKGKNGKPILKGIAFPTCISVNEIVCHASPLKSDDSFPNLKAGDVVKIDLGVHIDGFIAVVAHTHLVEGASELTAEELAVRKNVISATYTAAEVATKMLKVGNKNHQVTAAIKQVSDVFGVNAISNTVMHQMKHYVIDGTKSILLRESDSKVPEAVFEAGDVWTIEIAMSTGEGKPRDSAHRTTVYKRCVENKYALKNKISRNFFNELNQKFPTLPFSLHGFDDEKNTRLGIRECVGHDLVLGYPVLTEKKNEFVAQTKFTVLIMPSGNASQITGIPPQTYTELEGNADAAFKLSNAYQVGLALTAGKELPENIAELVNQAPVQSKKKAKKAAKAQA